MVRAKIHRRSKTVNFRVLTDDIRLPFSLGEKRKLRAARGSGISVTMQVRITPIVRSLNRALYGISFGESRFVSTESHSFPKSCTLSIFMN